LGETAAGARRHPATTIAHHRGSSARIISGHKAIRAKMPPTVKPKERSYLAVISFGITHPSEQGAINCEQWNSGLVKVEAKAEV
jgi:hypothetical protein